MGLNASAGEKNPHVSLRSPVMANFMSQRTIRKNKVRKKETNEQMHSRNIGTEWDLNLQSPNERLTA